MPFITVDRIRLFYRLEGQAGRPVLILSHSIGTDHGMWAPQASDLMPHFQILRYDIRGHGASDAPSGDYSIEMLGREVLSLAEGLGIERFAFCGLSLGGAIGQWLGLHAAERLTALVLANTSAQFGSRSNWDNRIKMVSEGGMAAVVELAMQRFFSAETRGRDYAASVRSVILGTNSRGYIGCCAALREVDYRDSIGKIKVPTLVIAGAHDVSTPWDGHGEMLARGIPGARAIHLPTAHLSNLERPRSFNAALVEFLLRSKGTGDSLEAGFRARREILGDAHVDRAVASSDDFNRDFQDLITRYAWGAIWTRPGLDPRTRRLLALAAMASMGRWEEFRMHVQAGLTHELEPADLKEMLLQTAVYAGVPAANTGFHIAGEELAKLKAK